MPTEAPRNAAGRPKGSPNKIGSEVKRAILDAFQEVGGKDYLIKLATEHPKVFGTLLAKTVPNEIEMDIRFNELSEEEINHRLLNTLTNLNAADNNEPTAH